MLDSVTPTILTPPGELANAATSVKSSLTVHILDLNQFGLATFVAALASKVAKIGCPRCLWAIGISSDPTVAQNGQDLIMSQHDDRSRQATNLLDAPVCQRLEHKRTPFVYLWRDARRYWTGVARQ